jgi:hypothetical protein
MGNKQTNKKEIEEDIRRISAFISWVGSKKLQEKMKKKRRTIYVNSYPLELLEKLNINVSELCDVFLQQVAITTLKGISNTLKQEK